MRLVGVWCLIWAAGLGLAAGAVASELLPGPVPADVVSVIDGDTLDVRAHVWLGQTVAIRVRLDGIDTPELRGRCAAERTAAEAARELVRARIGADPVRLMEVRYGKYAGRVLARIVLEDGEDLGAILLAAGLGRPYDGGARAPWCEELAGR